LGVVSVPEKKPRANWAAHQPRGKDFVGVPGDRHFAPGAGLGLLWVVIVHNASFSTGLLKHKISRTGIVHPDAHAKLLIVTEKNRRLAGAALYDE
jgi:hypothetical protein